MSPSPFSICWREKNLEFGPPEDNVVQTGPFFRVFSSSETRGRPGGCFVVIETNSNSVTWDLYNDYDIA